MKKILSILLTLVMLMGCVSIGVSANVGSGEPIQRIAIGDGDTTVTDGGVTYNVIRTVAQFKAMESGKNYILANDIDFGGETLIEETLFNSISVTLEGNYYSLLDYNGGESFRGLFTLYDASTVIIRNLTVGSESTPIDMNYSTDNAGAGVIASYLRVQDAILKCENVHVYADITSTKFCIGGFVGRMTGNCTAEFTDCSVSGSITSEVGKMGGFVGLKEASTLKLDGCVNNADVLGVSNIGGFIGIIEKSEKKLTELTDCVNNGDIAAESYGCGGLIGKCAPKGGYIQIDNCANNGTLSTTGTAVKGGYIGDVACEALALVGLTGTDEVIGKLSEDTSVTYEAFPEDVFAEKPAERPSDYTFTSIQIPDGAESVAVGSDTYTVIRTAEELMAINADGNYVLANDIDFENKIFNQKIFSDSWNGIFDGNGFAFKNFSLESSSQGNGIFLADAGTKLTVRNLNIGSENSPIEFKVGNQKMSGLICGQVGENAVVTVENVYAYATVSGGWQTGGFFGRGEAGCTITLNTCTMNGSVASTAGKSGGFVGDNDGSTIFTNCINNADFSAASMNNGGFIGLSNKQATVLQINGCIQRGSVITTNATWGTGGFIGKTWSKVIIANSRVEGDVDMTPVKGDTTAVVGKYIGETLGSDFKVALPLGETKFNNELVGKCTSQTVIPQNVISIINAEGLRAMSGNGWYRLEFDLTLTEAVEISGGDISGVTLDLNGKTITGELVVKAGTVVIGNGTLCSANTGYAITAKGDSTVILDGKAKITGNNGVCVSESAKVILNNVDISVANTAAACEDSTADAELTIKGATLKAMGGASSDAAIKWDSLATLRVEDGTVSADGDGVGIQYVNGNIEVTGGVISGKYALVIDGTSGSSLTVSGGEFNGTAAAVYDKGNEGDVQIVGGLFKGDSDGAFAAENGFSSNVKVIGGNFDEVVPNEYLQKGVYTCKFDTKSETYYVIKHTHTYDGCKYEQLNIGSHNKFCTVCGESISEAHSWGEYVDAGDGTHYRECSLCGKTSTHQKHTEEVDEKGNTVCPTCKAVIKETDNTSATDSGASDTTEEKKGGCSSAVWGNMLVVLVAVALVALLKKKKEVIE